MSIATPATAIAVSRQPLRSIFAVAAGFLSVAVLALGTDELLHLLNVYPPWGIPMRSPYLNLLALSYRIVFTVIGGYLTARLAPRAPMRHVFIVAMIGMLFSIAGVVVAFRVDLGPRWYPIALAVTSLPAVWLGGVLQGRGQGGR
jgi:hypothetical protein